MMSGMPPDDAGDAGREAMIFAAYEAFNRRDMAAAVSIMTPDVAWANGWEGGHVHGHVEVRGYWLRQWQQFNPSVTPRTSRVADDGRLIVTVQQVVRDLDGMVVGAATVEHAYTFRDGLVARMDILNDDATGSAHG